MIRAILFDKDGTLLDLTRSWRDAVDRATAGLAAGDPALVRRIGQAIGYDPVEGRFLPGSPASAGSLADVVGIICKVVPGVSRDEAQILVRQVSSGPGVPHPVCDLPALFGALRARDVFLGVATNDDEGVARAQLEKVGIADQLDAIIGADSGYGCKPDPGMLTAFAAMSGFGVEHAVIVGDSLHDMLAGRRARYAYRIGVLTGPVSREVLAPESDVVLDSVAALPGWLDALQG